MVNKIRGFEVVADNMRKTTGEINLPTRADSKSAGYDIYSPIKASVKPNEIVKIWSDVKAYMQDNEVLLIDVRSSMGGKWMLANTLGVIDASYFGNSANDGNIGVFLKNISNEVQEIEIGDRIAQCIFVNYLTADNDKPLSDTRTGGFGSSGK